MQLTSLKDGLSGGVLRESLGGLTGQIPPASFNFDVSPREVNYVGADLLSGVTQGIWLGGQTSAAFIAFSVVWMLLAVGLQATVGVPVALVLERPGMRFTALWRTLFILPWAIPEVVGAVAWRDLVYPERGLIAQLTGSTVSWPDVPRAVAARPPDRRHLDGLPLVDARRDGRAADDPALRRRGRRDRGRRPLARVPARHACRCSCPCCRPRFIVRGIATFNQFYLFWVLGPNENTTTVPTLATSLVRAEPFYYSVSAALNVVTIVALAVVVAWFLRWRCARRAGGVRVRP